MKNLYELETYYVIEDKDGKLRKVSDYDFFRHFNIKTGYIWNNCKFYLYNHSADNYSLHIDDKNDKLLSEAGFVAMLNFLERRHNIKFYCQPLYNRVSDLYQEEKERQNNIPF
jgi:hypothetical protein